MSATDLADLEKLLPGAVDSAREWFRMYKTADGASFSPLSVRTRPVCPGVMRLILRVVRRPRARAGKPQNKFAFDEKARDKQYALGVIDECSHSYKVRLLVCGETDRASWHRAA